MASDRIEPVRTEYAAEPDRAPDRGRGLRAEPQKEAVFDLKFIGDFGLDHLDPEGEDKENIDFALIPEAYYVGFDVTDLSAINGHTVTPTATMDADDVMAIDIAVIQNLIDDPMADSLSVEMADVVVDGDKLKRPQIQCVDSPTTTTSRGSVSGTEITSFHGADLSGTNSLNDHSYNVLSETTDFTNSEEQTEDRVAVQTEDVDAVSVRNEEKEYFNDDQFHLLAEQIMHEDEWTDTHRGTAAHSVQSQHRSPSHLQYGQYHHLQSLSAQYQPFRRSELSKSATSRNIWREPPSPSSSNVGRLGGRACTQTLAGLLMNGLEPISSQFIAT